MEMTGGRRLEGLSEKIFLDRYAWKNADTNETKVGDVVLVLTKDDPKFPAKEVGEVVARSGDKATVRLRSGDLVESSVEKLTLTLEKTPKEMWNRLASAMASVEKGAEKQREWERNFNYILDDWKLVPGGRIAAGAGASEELTLFNCYVVPSPKDSRGGIMQTLMEMTEIMARGGGVGMNLSSLRPRRAIVAGVNGSSSGAVSWGGLFSYTTGLIEQGGSRRGALMIMINDWHPDVLEFITVKQTMGQVTNANLSVCVSNAFMKAVKDDLDWELVFPDTKEEDYNELWNGDIEEWRRLGKKIIHYNTVKARDVWHTIIDSAWKSAEPGVVFMEYYNQMSNSWYFNPIISTNPCFHADTRIATEFGLQRISELYKQVENNAFEMVTDNRLIQQAKAVGGRSYESVGTSIRSARVFPTGKRLTFKVSLANGMEIKVTPEHRIYTSTGWKEAQHLTPNDLVYIQSGKGGFSKNDQLGEQWGMFLGWMTGDGWLSKRGDIGMVFGQEDKEIISHMIEAGEKFSGVAAKRFQRDNGTCQLYWWRKAFREKLIDLGIKAVPAGEKQVPSCIFTASRETVVAYLQALFSADGTVYDKDEMHRTVRLTSSSKLLLQDVQMLLLNFGIHGHIYSRNKKQQKHFEYTTKTGDQRIYVGKPFFELIISGNNIVVFKEEIGFKYIIRKQDALERISRKSRKNEKFVSKVVSVSEGDIVEVYDITEPITNSLIANGFVAHNCGEQGLPGWGVCNLSAVNLSKFYDEEKHDVAWDELAKVTRWSVRFLDNVIDKTPYHFEENERNQKLERRIGLGTMGLAELMIKLGIRYGSAESLTFLDELYRFMARESYLASSEIAAEKGSFQAFDAEKYVQSGFMQHLIGAFPQIGEAVKKNGIRNVTVITQAPTGSTGTMVGTSTGIEPYFAFEYFRQSRLGFDKQYVPIAQAWKDAHPGEELPDYFVTAMSLSAEEHIRVQAAIQRWVDSSISKTANAPADFTVEETKRLYELAFELGCKGVTIYRDGSRDVQVLSTKNEEPVEVKNESAEQATLDPESAKSPAVDHDELFDAGLVEAAVPTDQGEQIVDRQYKRRPQVLRGATYKVNTPFGMAYITINDLNGIPGEIFLNVGKAGSDVFAMAEALGRVCSLFLRYGDHGNKVKLLIKHLKGIGGSGAIGFGVNRVESIADAVAKSLEMHIEQQAEQAAGDESDLSGDATFGEEIVDSNGSGEAQHHAEITSRDLCPSCGSATLINIEGCKQCSHCGYSKCN
ncbi:ribonucleoside-diphosphate reductase [Paenibacillus alkaliterrae]|uniref:LAGLIDADG family homing endonuclease n=1 Tax=Paenibacillus alkaliterrae TaxID=320909 RepID=UPI001F41AC77|nr:LAGLIDADG family homing endonuclease [Paenibacillus alkaliterrae]MCF2939865.1 ribonucleoside-diphosphate reductase [Paenibacillus alkaliterrae]